VIIEPTHKNMHNFTIYAKYYNEAINDTEEPKIIIIVVQLFTIKETAV